MLVDYSDEEESKAQQFKPQSLLVQATPDVDVSHLIKKVENERAVALSQLYDFEADPNKKNHLTGAVEKFNVNHLVFEEQFHQYTTFGVVQDPDERERRIIIDGSRQPELAELVRQGVDIEAKDVQLQNVMIGTNRSLKDKRKKIKQQRQDQGNAANGTFKGPWAEQQDENFVNVELTEEQREMLNQLELRRKQKVEEIAKKEETFEPYMEHHAKLNPELMGRPFTAPPPDLKNTDHTCYIPKRCIHTFYGHTNKIQVIKFYPRYGHLLLSGSMDCKVKMWDMNTTKDCVRTYVGHTEAIKDICFSNDGRHFLTAGYDKQVLYWDTEYGKAIQTFKTKLYPLCVKINPDINRQNLFLCGTASKKILQFDVNTGTKVQQYEEHLSAINTVTFFNHNRKFVSSSDDKKLFVWEFGIPVVIKHISEPEMHAVNSAVMHPNGLHWIGSQGDNQIIVYETKNGNFRQNRKKRFRGHASAGYACQVTFSPDGQFLASGDAEGRVFFWDWKGCKNYRTLQCHNHVVISVDWHPIEPSKFATASWDGSIKIWD